MKANDVVAGKRYVGRDGSVREVLCMSMDRYGCLVVDWVKVPGNTPRTCCLSTFARWAVADGVTLPHPPQDAADPR